MNDLIAQTVASVTATTGPVNPCLGNSSFASLCNVINPREELYPGALIHSFFLVAIVIVLIVLTYGGIKWFGAKKNKTKMKNARHIIIKALISLLLVLIIYGIFIGIEGLYGLS